MVLYHLIADKHISCLLRAGTARCQEEMLQQLGQIQEHTDYTSLRQELLPRAHRLALATTSAAVRAAAFTALAALAARFCESEQAEAMVTTMLQVCAYACACVCVWLSVRMGVCMHKMKACVWACARAYA